MNSSKEINELVKINDKVKTALQNNHPVVALESTLIAHGFPYPQNYNLALEIEEQTKKSGVVPATIAILDGYIKVGMEKEDLEILATDKKIVKASLRDLPLLLAKKINGGTTVASTMQIAEIVGIKVFVTGGIGGVHSNFTETLDISADLKALSTYRVVVVCAGAKAIIDISRTRELLETLGVPVLGYQTEDFPAFYFRESGIKVDYRIDSPEEIFEVMKIKEKLNIPGGVLVTVPIPKQYELTKTDFNHLLQKLLRETKEKNISGKNVTPYLLKRLNEETGGETVMSNIALIKNNLSVGCEIAKALSRGNI